MRSIGLMLLFVGLPAWVGCQKTPTPEAAPEAGPRVENAALGIALGSIPVPFELRHGEADTLVLARVLDEGGEGLVLIAAGPVETGGINLVEVAKQRNADFAALEGGESFGNRELGTQIGPAFTARGSYDSDGSRVEETWIFTLHPGENRLLRLSYRYPAGGDSGGRVNELMELLGEVEALAPAVDGS